MNTTKAKILLYPLLLLFLAFFSCCKQPEIELTDTSVINNSMDSISEIKPPTDYRKLCLQNPSYFSADSLYALRHLHLANPLYEEAAQQFENDSSFNELIHTLNRLAWSNMILGEKVSAKQFLDKAEKLAENHLSEDMVLWGEINRSLGYFYALTANYGESLKAYDISLDIYKNNYGEKSLQVAELYLLIGNLYNWYIMDQYNAIDNYFEALKILEILSYKEKEKYIFCLYNLAVANRKIGELNKAKTYVQNMLQIIDHNNPVISKYEEYGYSILANIYNSLDCYTDAISSYNKTIELNIKYSTNDKTNLANYYNNIGGIYMDIDSIKKGIEFCNKAKEINKIYHDSLYLSDSYEDLAFGYNKLNEHTLALEYLYKCLEIRRNIFFENHEQTSKAYLALGKYYSQIGIIDSSLYYFKKSIETGCDNFKFSKIYSLPRKESFGENYYLITSLHEMADLYRLKYEKSKQVEHLKYSMRLYQLCDSIIDISRNQFEMEESKLRYADNVQGIYEDAINIAYTLYNKSNDVEYFNSIFLFMEKNRARILSDNIHSVEMKSKSPLPDSIIEKEKRLNYRIKYMNQLIADAEHIEDSHEIDSLNIILFSVLREFERLKKSIRINYPAYYQLQYQFENIQLESLIKKFPNTTFVEYFWGEKAIYAIRFDKNCKVCYKSEGNLFIEESIKTIVALCNTSQASLEDDFSSYINHAYYLYKELIFPLLKTPLSKSGKKTESITIIPDGLLSFLPFEILIQDQANTELNNYKILNYLVNNYNIAYSFSCNFLSLTQVSKMKSKVNNVLAFGYSEDKSDHNKNNSRITEQVSLAGSKKELNVISKYFKGRFLNDQEATEFNFRKLCSDYDVIHLAIHGTYDSINNFNTYLIFNASADTVEDGYLYNYDLFPMKLKANLAVLSACETGLGKNNPGEGLISMGWGFAYAGCKSLILSLWKASDQSTSTLMEHFYKQFSSSKNINTSLSNAKRNYLRNADEYTAHPKYWASFVNYGNSQPLGIPKANQILIYISIFTLISFITISNYLKRKKRNVKSFRRRHNHK